MKRQRLVICFCLCLGAGLAQAEVYRWQDDNGKVVFGDTPPKDKAATAILIDNTDNSGTQFAAPELVKDMEDDAKNPRHPSRAPRHSPMDSRCRGYVSQLNKIEIYLQHTPTQRDRHRASDLRQLIKQECGDAVLSFKHDDWQCKRYREDLTKAEIYLQHTPTQRDRQRVKDLREQIARECR
jgi:hypothetical protein